MSKTLKRSLIAATAVVALVGLGTVGVHSIAQAQGWGGGPGMGGGMYNGDCMGPGGGGRGGHHGRFGGGRMGGGMGGAQMGGGMLGLMDDDADGTVTRAEFDSFHTLAFTALDADGDGTVTRQGFIDARLGTPMAGAGQAQATPRNTWRAEMRAERLGARFDALDTDQDGALLASEFAASADARFATLDVNEDGAVTRQEMAVQRMFGPRGGVGGPMGGGMTGPTAQ